jgi:hypothetical protein
MGGAGYVEELGGDGSQPCPHTKNTNIQNMLKFKINTNLIDCSNIFTQILVPNSAAAAAL